MRPSPGLLPLPVSRARKSRALAHVPPTFGFVTMPPRRRPASQARLRLRQPVAREEQPAPAKRRWWQVPLWWFSEETFWRDVSKSAVSTGVVALIAYLYALAAGYIATPAGPAVGVIFLSTLSALFLLLCVRAARMRNFSSPKPLLALSFLLFVVMAITDLTRDDSDALWDRIAFHWTTTLALLNIATVLVFSAWMRGNSAASRS